MPAKQKTITSLRTSLNTVFDGLIKGTVDPKNAKEINNTAGKIMNSVKLEMEYAKFRKEAPNIEFMDK